MNDYMHIQHGYGGVGLSAARDVSYAALPLCVGLGAASKRLYCNEMQCINNTYNPPQKYKTFPIWQNNFFSAGKMRSPLHSFASRHGGTGFLTKEAGAFLSNPLLAKIIFYVPRFCRIFAR